MYDTQYSKVSYDEKIGAVVCLWKKNNDIANYRTTMMEAMKVLLETNCKTWISDFYDEVSELSKDQEWFVNTFLPMTVNDSIENIFFIVPPASPLKGKVEVELGSIFEEFFNVQVFESMEDIYSYLDEKNKY